MFSRLLLFFSVPIMILGFFLVFGSYRKLTAHYQELVRQENLRVRSVLFDLTTNLYSLSDRFISDGDLVSLLSESYSSEQDARKSADGYGAVKKILGQESSLSSITVYTNNEKLAGHSCFVFCDAQVQQTDWYQSVTRTRNAVWCTEKAPENVRTAYVLCLYRLIPIPLSGDFAILKLTVSANYLNNRLKNSYMPSVITVNGDKCFYNGGDLAQEEDFPLGNLTSEQYYQMARVEQIRGKRYVTSVTTLIPYRCDDFIYALTYSGKAWYDILHQTLLYALLVLAAFLIPCFLLYFYTGYFSARIDVLRMAMHQASQGDYNVMEVYRGDDELSETFRDMKLVIHEIQEKEADIYRARLREQQLINRQQELENRQQQIEYRVLASQINPHFLYNTLESIRMKAFIEDDHEVANAIKLLGKYLHYALESMGETETTLKRELSYMELYLQIQKLRFKDRVNYEIRVADGIDTEQLKIMPFLLQPIAENAVLHGLEGITDHGELVICVEEEDDLRIRITDNGEGMTEEELEHLREMMKNQEEIPKKSIGLSNIERRIRLRYGETYGMTIDSRKGEGTTVILKLPVLMV